MISHYYKCIFIHIPKTAGTSVRYLLSNKKLIDPEDHFSNFLQLGDKKSVFVHIKTFNTC